LLKLSAAEDASWRGESLPRPALVRLQLMAVIPRSNRRLLVRS